MEVLFSPAAAETDKSGHGEGHSFMVIFKCSQACIRLPVWALCC